MKNDNYSVWIDEMNDENDNKNNEIKNENDIIWYDWIWNRDEWN